MLICLGLGLAFTPLAGAATSGAVRAEAGLASGPAVKQLSFGRGGSGGAPAECPPARQCRGESFYFPTGQ